MHRSREHIARLHFLYFITMFSQPLHISCQGGGVAAYVHDAFRLHFDHSFESGGITAFTGRVDDDDIDRLYAMTLFVSMQENFYLFKNNEFSVNIKE